MAHDELKVLRSGKKPKKPKKPKKVKKVKKPKKKKVKRFKNVTNVTEQSISRQLKEKQTLPLMDTQYPQEVPYRQQVLFGGGSFNQVGDRFDNTIAQNERIKLLEQDVADAKERLLHQPLQPSEMAPPMGETINIGLQTEPLAPSAPRRRTRARMNATRRRRSGYGSESSSDVNLSDMIGRPPPEQNVSENINRPPPEPVLAEVLAGASAPPAEPIIIPTNIRYRADGVTPIRAYNRRPKPTITSVLQDPNAGM